MAAPFKITRHDLDSAGLRRAARRACSVAASRLMLARAPVLEGVSRAEAAQAAGMDRQTPRDWVHRYNAEVWPSCPTVTEILGPNAFSRPRRRANWRNGSGVARTWLSMASSAGAGPT